jgi:uncharacterized membrane-anchored protein
VFLAVILVPAAGYKWLRLNEVLAFWLAYTVTRPLGLVVSRRRPVDLASVMSR